MHGPGAGIRSSAGKGWKIPSGQGLDVKGLVRHHMPKLQGGGHMNNQKLEDT